MRMRKYLFNGAVISAAIGLWSTVQSSKQGPKDWRVPLMWINAALSLVIAIGAVIAESKEAEERERQPVGARGRK
jgi:cytochrome bd-type quinol oxidase subunit 2